MESRFREAVETIIGRHVIAFMSRAHFNPDMGAEIFVLEAEGADRTAEQN